MAQAASRRLSMTGSAALELGSAATSRLSFAGRRSTAPHQNPSEGQPVKQAWPADGEQQELSAPPSDAESAPPSDAEQELPASEPADAEHERQSRARAAWLQDQRLRKAAASEPADAEQELPASGH